MFYKQTVENIEVVVLSLDGGLLDLNRLRYNYFKRICKIHNYTITKQDFENHLGNMNTMYNNFPIADDIIPSDINKLIERDLYEYAKLQPSSIIKEGTEELLQFFKQKNIKIAVISTHKIKKAIQYLQLTKLFDKVDFIIGGDSDNPPLPNPYLLEIISTQLNTSPKNILVVANYPTLLYGANKKLMNVIYLNDLYPANKSISSRVFKVAKNNFEVMNYVLFARYDSMEMYSPLLGMSSDMNIATLEHTYHNLLEAYQNDAQLLELVKETYHYFLGEIIEHKPDKIEPSLFADDDTLPLYHKENKANFHNHFVFSDEIDDNEKLTTIDKENNSPTISTIKAGEQTKKSVIGGNPKRVNELMDIINGTTTPPRTSEVKRNNKTKKLSCQNTPYSLRIINFFYTLLIVATLSIFSLFVYVGFKDFLNGPGIFANLLNKIITLYISVVDGLYSIFFNSLHQLFAFIPNYSTFTANNSILSTLAIKLILFIFFNVTIVYLVKFFINLNNNPEELNET